jgi:glycosyltransferase involved in cell wall biosynthesis
MNHKALPNRPLRVIHIITDLNDGGAEAVLYRLCTTDLSNQHQVISLMDQGKYGALLSSSGIPVYCINFKRNLASFFGLFKLWQLIRQLQPDVVQTWLYHADFLGGITARLAGVRNLCWGIRNTTMVAGKSKRLTRVIAKLCAWLSHFVPRHIICCANKAAEDHQKLGYAAKKLVVISNGYDFSQFRPNYDAGLALRRIWQVGDDCFLLGMVGRYDPQKDHRNLLAALAEFKSQGSISFRCVLVGKGLTSENAALQEDLHKYALHDSVILLGQRLDIPVVMNALDVHVLSSAYGEGFPNVLAEAMACGTPCITTDVGDAAQIVAEHGWLVSPNDPAALAKALQDAWQARQDSPTWQVRRSACHQHIVDHFNIENTVEAFRKVWQED